MSTAQLNALRSQIEANEREIAKLKSQAAARQSQAATRAAMNSALAGLKASLTDPTATGKERRAALRALDAAGEQVTEKQRAEALYGGNQRGLPVLPELKPIDRAMGMYRKVEEAFYDPNTGREVLGAFVPLNWKK